MNRNSTRAIVAIAIAAALPSVCAEVYDATIEGREILTPPAPPEARITGASIFGVRPGKPIFFRVPATGTKPVTFAARGLPPGVSIDSKTGWITGRAPNTPGDVVIDIAARNATGRDIRKFTLRVGETICLTPPMGWNSWYVHSEGVSDAAIREMAVAMDAKGLGDHGWSYINIDDCWSGERDPETKAIQPNAKFGDMKALSGFVNHRGFKLGIYSTAWMSTYAGYIGGSAPNKEADYSEYQLPENERQNPHQIFGRYPNGIRKGLCTIGTEWLVDVDARQFADWGIDFVKYDWKEWTLVKQNDGSFTRDKKKTDIKTEAVTKRFHDDFRALDRDIVLSLSPNHVGAEDRFVPDYCNLWRLTGDIHASWNNMTAPFALEGRLQLTRPGAYGDLDMLQIGPLGKPNRAETVFKPSPLTPSEQYHQVSLWCLLTQPMLLSCNVPTMDDFDLGLVTNDEVLAINQDALASQGFRVRKSNNSYEIWAKKLADGGVAVGMFNLFNKEQVLTLKASEIGFNGMVRDLWRQRNIGDTADSEQSFSANVSAHGVAFVRITPTSEVTAAPAGPINYQQSVDAALEADADISGAFPEMSEYGDNHYGGIGAESKGPALAPDSKSDDDWIYFQTGDGGKEAGLRIDLGHALDPAMGHTLKVLFLLGSRDGLAVRSPVRVALTDGPAGTVVASKEITPVYATDYADVPGSKAAKGESKVEVVTLEFDAGPKKTHRNLTLDISMRDPAKEFRQGQIKQIRVTQH